MDETAREQMIGAVDSWLKTLDLQQGRKEFQRKKMRRTLLFDEPIAKFDNPEYIFKFSSKEEEQRHEIIVRYLELESRILSLKECEYYFRRFPFRGLPVTKYSHLTNVCEMYFSRFYEFKERLKEYFKAVEIVTPNHHLDIGKFIKLFSKTFKSELRERNIIHHHEGFAELSISRLFLMESIMIKNSNKREHITEYRKLTKEWVLRVQKNGKKLDQFLEAVAKVTLENCDFLKG